MEPLEHIVIATDFSEAARPALSGGARLAVQNGARVTIVHVQALELAAVGQMEQSDAAQKEHEAAALAELDRLRREELGEVPDVSTAVVHDGSAADAICRFAEVEGASLIVLTTHGRTGLAHLLIGSVAEKVVRHAPCAVLTLRPKTTG